ncbi:MAG: substrate-binding domain-containing protein [Halobacteriota archaeon]
MKGKHSVILVCAIVIALVVAGAGCTNPLAPASESKPQLLLATTTSLYDTGLLDYLKPFFEQEYNVSLKITSQGTGKALELASRGDADVLAVHSPAQESAFINSSNGMNQRCFATNYFIIVGPQSDPAAIKGLNATQAFQKIYQLGKNNTPGVSFVSRGDQSGTHVKEQDIWKAAGYNYTTQIRGSGPWYVESGQGMGATLQLTDQKQGYTISDEGTFLAYKSNLTLTPQITGGNILLNRYSVITVYNASFTQDKIKMANNFVNFMISNDTQQKIGQYGVQQYGKALFTPMYGNCSAFNCDCTTPATALVPPTLSATSTATANSTTARTATSSATATAMMMRATAA